MTFEELQTIRKSCRSYSDKPVSRELLSHLADVAVPLNDRGIYILKRSQHKTHFTKTADRQQRIFSPQLPAD